MNFKYSLNEWPPLRENIVFALQWFMLSVPLIIILGKAVAGTHYPQQPELQLAYLQKLFLVSGIILLTQLAAGHKLPLIVGPSSVLLTGIVANAATAASDVIYFSIMVGGAIITMLSAVGVLSRITALFTEKIIGVVLILIAFTMLPTVLNLITSGPGAFAQLVFAAVLLIMMFVGHSVLPDPLRSTIIVWALIAGSIVYYLLLAPIPSLLVTSHTFAEWGLTPLSLTLDPGVLISFLFCFLALLANDVGSIQTTAQLLSLTDVQSRTRSGVIISGLGNMLAGFLGVIGPVNFSISTGVILSTGCASRYTLVPAAAGIILLSFTPGIIQAFSYIPPVVIGSLLFYMMCTQVAGGLGVLRQTLQTYNFETGITIGVPIMVGTLISFLPSHTAGQIPALLRPLLANGFVVGVTTALILEHFQAHRSEKRE